MRSFSDLTERDLLALAISSEEEDGRIYADFAHELQEDYPDSARMFADMAAEENEHRRRLIDAFAERFGPHIPLVRRADVRGWVQRKPGWQVRAQGIEAVRRHVQQMEQDAGRFYQQAASRTTDAAIRKLLGDLAAAELEHQHTAGMIEQKRLPGEARVAEDEGAQRRFVLQVIQPGLVGLMDGSVSTAGGIGHTLPYLIPDFVTATIVAGAVVVAELLAIAWIQWRYMDTPPLSAAAKVMLGGALVLATGILIGNA